MTAVHALLTVGAGAGAVVAVGAAGAFLVRAERRGRRIVTGLLGDDERPGALRRLATVETAVQEIKTQLSPNSGGSLHDKVTRIDERTVLFGERLDLHAERLDKQTKALDEHLVAPHPRR